MERLHRFPLQIDPISVVHQAVEDGVGQRPNKAPVKGGPKTDAKPARQAQEKLPVSYTHLDVYKRQHTHFAMKYLVKDDQHLRLKPAGARCLRKGALNRARRG